MEEKEKKEADVNTEQKGKEEPSKVVNLHKTEQGLNLIAPHLQKIEEETQKKFQIDIRVVLFVFFVVLVSLGIVGYNWYVSMRLSNEEATFNELVDDLESYRYTIEANNQILERYELYEKIQEGFISSKEVLNFWRDVSVDLAEVRRIELSDGVSFEVFGKAETLRDVTKLWHFLSIDDRVNIVSLESVNIPAEDVEDPRLSFSFKGILNLEYFNERK